MSTPEKSPPPLVEVSLDADLDLLCASAAFTSPRWAMNELNAKDWNKSSNQNLGLQSTSKLKHVSDGKSGHILNFTCKLVFYSTRSINNLSSSC